MYICSETNLSERSELLVSCKYREGLCPDLTNYVSYVPLPVIPPVYESGIGMHWEGEQEFGFVLENKLKKL